MFVSSIFVCLVVTASAFPQERQLQKCNGFSEFCDRKYSNVSLIGANNSPMYAKSMYAKSTDNFAFQQIAVSEQLALGVRFLRAEVYNDNKVASVCFKHCTGTRQDLVCKGTLQDFLQVVSTFLDNNVNEVVTVSLINGGQISVQVLDSPFASTRLKPIAFEPSTRPLSLASWPTYGDMISKGRRLVVFLDSGAVFNDYPYLLPQKDYFFETQKNKYQKCDVEPSGADTQSKMYIMNHFLTYQDRVGGYACATPERTTILLTISNSASEKGLTGPILGHALKNNIGQHAASCEVKFKQIPNVVLLDSVNIPKENGPFVAQKNLNGLK